MGRSWSCGPATVAPTSNGLRARTPRSWVPARASASTTRVRPQWTVPSRKSGPATAVPTRSGTCPRSGPPGADGVRAVARLAERIVAEGRVVLPDREQYGDVDRLGGLRQEGAVAGAEPGGLPVDLSGSSVAVTAGSAKLAVVGFSRLAQRPRSALRRRPAVPIAPTRYGTVARLLADSVRRGWLG
jgi:hypothetical protein